MQLASHPLALSGALLCLGRASTATKQADLVPGYTLPVTADDSCHFVDHTGVLQGDRYTKSLSCRACQFQWGASFLIQNLHNKVVEMSFGKYNMFWLIADSLWLQALSKTNFTLLLIAEWVDVHIFVASFVKGLGVSCPSVDVSNHIL